MKAHFIFFISLAALQQVCAKNLNCNVYKLVYPLPLFRATKFTMLVCQFISTSIMQKCNSRMCISTSITPKVYVGLWGTCMTSRAALSVPTMSFPSFNLTAATLLNEMEMWTQCVALRCAVLHLRRVIFVSFIRISANVITQTALGWVRKKWKKSINAFHGFAGVLVLLLFAFAYSALPWDCCVGGGRKHRVARAPCRIKRLNILREIVKRVVSTLAAALTALVASVVLTHVVVVGATILSRLFYTSFHVFFLLLKCNKSALIEHAAIYAFAARCLPRAAFLPLPLWLSLLLCAMMMMIARVRVLQFLPDCVLWLCLNLLLLVGVVASLRFIALFLRAWLHYRFRFRCMHLLPFRRRQLLGYVITTVVRAAAIVAGIIVVVVVISDVLVILLFLVFSVTALLNWVTQFDWLVAAGILFNSMKLHLLWWNKAGIFA